jgi:hypothetical protein
VTVHPERTACECAARPGAEAGSRHTRGLLGADRDLVWRVGGHDQVRSDVSGAVPIEHQQSRCCGNHLNAWWACASVVPIDSA